MVQDFLEAMPQSAADEALEFVSFHCLPQVTIPCRNAICEFRSAQCFPTTKEHMRIDLPGNCRVALCISETNSFGELTMLRYLSLGLSVFVVSTGAVAAQSASPSYEADPSVYKVIFEDQNFRVISATWKKGVTDKQHSHLLPFVTYALDDCTVKVHNADGTTRDFKVKTGNAGPGPITTSHAAENVTDADCHGLLIERK